MGSNGTFYDTFQSVVGGSWSAWEPVTGAFPGGTLQGSPTVLINPSGSPYANMGIAFAMGSNGTFYDTFQSVVGGSWSAWGSRYERVPRRST